MQRMLKLLWLCAVFVMALSADAQIRVESFTEVTTDLDARVNYPLADKSSGRAGDMCAIIKVVTNDMGYTFSIGSSMMIAKTEKHPDMSEIWLYVPVGTNKIKIGHPQYGQLDSEDGYYWFTGQKCKSATVYRMKIQTDYKVRQEVVYDVKMQMVKFQTSPVVQGAIVTVKNELTQKKESLGVTASNGAISKALGFGRYSYEVLAPDNLYYPSEGIITLSSSDDVFTENVVLRPQFAEISLSVEGNADIFINNELKGKGKWNGKLSFGTYIVTCKKENHRDSQQKLVVEEGKSQTITLNTPTPITGTLIVNTTPTDAHIKIDGKDYGEAPKIIKDLLVGEHKVELALDGHKTFVQNVKVEENKSFSMEAVLEEGYQAAVNSSDKMKTFTVGGVQFNMILVEAGTFTMGSTTGDSDEQLTPQVTISTNYYMGETEVTQALWKAVTGHSPTSGGPSWLSKYGLGNNYPAYNVSYEDVQSFISKLNDMTGMQFRLPTEAEWEYAAKGGNKSDGYTYSGSNKIGHVAWYTRNSGSKTHEVKKKAANELGLYDMSGNVWEWCADWYSSSYYTSTAVTDPTGPTTGSYRVIRGGSWSSDAMNCRSVYRDGSATSNRGDNVGFRLAL